MKPGRIRYEESTPWPAWMAVLVLASFLLPAFLVWRDAAEDGSLPALVVVGLLVLGPGVLWLLLGRMRVQVTRDSLHLSYGFLPLIRRRVPFEEIEDMEPVRYSPLREFGGWGVRWGPGGKRAWTIRGDRALRLTLTGGKLLYVGSESPARLAERMRGSSGSRAGAEPPRR